MHDHRFGSTDLDAVIGGKYNGWSAYKHERTEGIYANGWLPDTSRSAGHSSDHRIMQLVKY